MRKTAISLLLIPVGLSAIAQNLRSPVTNAFNRLNTYSLSHANVTSFTANQAALAPLDHFSAGIYSERRFLVAQLSWYSATVALPASSGSFGFKGDYFGDASYNETGVGLAYGRKLTDQVDIGLQINYYSFRLAGYGTASTINAEGGLMVHFSDELKIGVHVYNPTGVSVGKRQEEKLPVIVSVGLGYDVSKKVFMGAEVEKIESLPLNANVGLHYYFDEKLFAGAGLATATSSYYLAFGVLLKNNQLNVVAAKHPQLGITPGLQLIFNLAGRNHQQRAQDQEPEIKHQ